MPNPRWMFLRAAGALCLLAMTTLPAFAQTPTPIPPGPLTLEQVLTLAEPRSESVAIAQAGVRRAEGVQVQARSGRYPQLSAAASYDRALASEFEGVFDEGFFGGDSSTDLSDLPFGRKNTWRVNLVFSQNRVHPTSLPIGHAASGMSAVRSRPRAKRLGQPRRHPGQTPLLLRARIAHSPTARVGACQPLLAVTIPSCSLGCSAPFCISRRRY